MAETVHGKLRISRLGPAACRTQLPGRSSGVTMLRGEHFMQLLTTLDIHSTTTWLWNTLHMQPCCLTTRARATLPGSAAYVMQAYLGASLHTRHHKRTVSCKPLQRQPLSCTIWWIRFRHSYRRNATHSKDYRSATNHQRANSSERACSKRDCILFKIVNVIVPQS